MVFQNEPVKERSSGHCWINHFDLKKSKISKTKTLNLSKDTHNHPSAPRFLRDSLIIGKIARVEIEILGDSMDRAKITMTYRQKIKMFLGFLEREFIFFYSEKKLSRKNIQFPHVIFMVICIFEPIFKTI